MNRSLGRNNVARTSLDRLSNRSRSGSNNRMGLNTSGNGSRLRPAQMGLRASSRENKILQGVQENLANLGMEGDTSLL